MGSPDDTLADLEAMVFPVVQRGPGCGPVDCPPEREEVLGVPPCPRCGGLRGDALGPCKGCRVELRQQGLKQTRAQAKATATAMERMAGRVWG